jgi:hypothetical protein
MRSERAISTNPREKTYAAIASLIARNSVSNARLSGIAKCTDL